MRITSSTTREDFAEGDQRYDLILDIGGNSSLARLRRALTPREPSSSLEAGKDGGSEAQIASFGRCCYRRSWARSWFIARRTRGYDSSSELIESGKLTPVINRTYPLAEVPEAIRYLEEGHARGKVVITV